MKVKLKPRFADAIKWTGENYEEFFTFIDSFGPRPKITGSMGTQMIPTIDGFMACTPGDWLVYTGPGTFFVYSPDIFEKTFDLLD